MRRKARELYPKDYRILWTEKIQELADVESYAFSFSFYILEIITDNRLEVKKMSEDKNKAMYTRKRERKTNRLNMRVSDSEMELLNKLSYENDESISQIVRKAIKAYASGK